MKITWNSVNEPPKKSGRYWVVPDWVLDPNHFRDEDEMLNSKLTFAEAFYDADSCKWYDGLNSGFAIDTVLYWTERFNITVADFLEEVGVDITGGII